MSKKRRVTMGTSSCITIGKLMSYVTRVFQKVLAIPGASRASHVEVHPERPFHCLDRRARAGRGLRATTSVPLAPYDFREERLKRSERTAALGLAGMAT